MKIVSKWTELEKILLSKMTRPRKKKEKKKTRSFSSVVLAPTLQS